MNTAQVAKTVSPSVVVITTEQVVYLSLIHIYIRDSKNIGFIALSDGGCFKTLQVVPAAAVSGLTNRVLFIT